MWLQSPRIYEINTWVWLTTLSARYNRKVTLSNVPNEVVDQLANYHIDAVWLMGVWRRGPSTVASALNYIDQYRGALPDISSHDVVGSAYALAEYEVERELGGREGLAIFRRQLRERGLRLILDFVPNHTGHDSPWLQDHPAYYVQGPKELLNKGFFEVKRRGRRKNIIVANGRDPYFDPWIDTAQLNAFSKTLRDQMVRTLKDIAEQADGVRCDMAMLMMNDIFSKTWGWLDDMEAPDEDFWDYVIPRVRRDHNDFIFIAEAYWDLNYALLQQGFDYTYDKTMYDRLCSGDVGGVKAHLSADLSFLERQIRFIENHDEPRAATEFGIDRSRPAAVIISTVPGATLLHDGQFTGRRVKLPVQINRQPNEPEHKGLREFYVQLMEEASDDIYREGTWTMFDVYAACEGCQGEHNIIAYGWQREDEYRLIACNLSGVWSQGTIHLGTWQEALAEPDWVLLDVLHQTYIEEWGTELSERGLRIDLEPYQTAIFHFRQLADQYRHKRNGRVVRRAHS